MLKNHIQEDCGQSYYDFIVTSFAKAHGVSEQDVERYLSCSLKDCSHQTSLNTSYCYELALWFNMYGPRLSFELESMLLKKATQDFESYNQTSVIKVSKFLYNQIRRQKNLNSYQKAIFMDYALSDPYLYYDDHNIRNLRFGSIAFDRLQSADLDLLVNPGNKLLASIILSLLHIDNRSPSYNFIGIRDYHTSMFCNEMEHNFMKILTRRQNGSKNLYMDIEKGVPVFLEKCSPDLGDRIALTLHDITVNNYLVPAGSACSLEKDTSRPYSYDDTDNVSIFTLKNISSIYPGRLTPFAFNEPRPYIDDKLYTEKNTYYSVICLDEFKEYAARIITKVHDPVSSSGLP